MKTKPRDTAISVALNATILLRACEYDPRHQIEIEIPPEMRMKGIIRLPRDYFSDKVNEWTKATPLVTRKK